MIGLHQIPNRQPGEEVVFHLRRHWFIFFKIFAGLGLATLLPVVVFFLLASQWPGLLLPGVTHDLLLLLALVYYLALLVFALTAWTVTYLDVWTVTTFRIISREQSGLFNRTVSELDLYRVQDVAAEQKGFFATIFGFGDVYIQSAAEKERFIFSQIPHPYRIAKIIQKLDEQAKKDNTGL